MRAGEADNVTGELDRGALHAQANAEEGNAALASELNGLDLPFDAALAKAAGDEDPVVAGEQRPRAFALDLFALDSANADLALVVNAGMIEGLVDRLVGVLVLGVLADDGDADLML